MRIADREFSFVRGSDSDRGAGAAGRGALMESLSVMQAYAAMCGFLEREYELTKSDDIGALLGGLSLAPDGLPCDPAVQQAWLDAVDAAKAGQPDLRRRTPAGAAF